MNPDNQKYINSSKAARKYVPEKLRDLKLLLILGFLTIVVACNPLPQDQTYAHPSSLPTAPAANIQVTCTEIKYVNQLSEDSFEFPRSVVVYGQQVQNPYIAGDFSVVPSIGEGVRVNECQAASTNGSILDPKDPYTLAAVESLALADAKK